MIKACKLLGIMSVDLNYLRIRRYIEMNDDFGSVPEVPRLNMNDGLRIAVIQHFKGN